MFVSSTAPIMLCTYNFVFKSYYSGRRHRVEDSLRSSCFCVIFRDQSEFKLEGGGGEVEEK